MKKSNIFISTIIIITMIVSLFSFISATTEQLIYTEDDLKNISLNLSGSYKLMNDITLSEKWNAIGNISSPFTGTLDGNGFSIKNLEFAKNITNNGLFGYTNGATFINLSVYADVNNSFGEYEANSLNSKGNPYSSTACFAGTGKNSTFTSCYSYGNVLGSIQVGGICGTSYNCTFTSCKNYAEVSGMESVGGITGYCAGTTITLCANYGNITSKTNAGGILGLSRPIKINGVLLGNNIISKSYNTAKINCSNLREGGIVGYVNNSLANCSFTVENSYNIGRIYSENEFITSGGIIGVASKTYGTISATNCYNAGAIQNKSKAYGIATSNKVTVSGCYSMNNGTYSYLAPDDSTSLTSYNDMCLSSTFDGFDFSSVWVMRSSGDFKYPDLIDNPIDFTQKVVDADIISMPTVFYLYYSTETTVSLTGLSVKVYMADGTVNSSSNTSDFTLPKYTLHLGINTIPVTYKSYAIKVPYIVINDFSEKNTLAGMGNYYPVYSEDDLLCISDYPSQNYYVMNDIVCSSDFKGICSIAHPFTGNFIGSDNTITMDKDTNANGLFNGTNGAKISGINVVGSINGTDFAGSIVGYGINTIISDCTSSVTLTCASSGDIAFLGGFAGLLECSTTEEITYSNCAFNGKLIANATCNDTYIGNIFGEIVLLDNTTIKVKNLKNNGETEFSSHGSVCTGGIIGCIYARSGVSDIQVSECYSSGMLNGKNYDDNLYVGGLVGDYIQYKSTSKMAISDCFNIIRNSTINTSSSKKIYAGGIISSLGCANSQVDNCYVLGAYKTSSSSKPYAVTSTLNFEGTINNCYVLPSGNETFNNEVILTKEQSVIADSYSDFDFTNVWTFKGEYKHPVLRNIAFDESILTSLDGDVQISGTPTIGSTLTASADNYLYQWYRDGEAIKDATNRTYTVVEEDLFKDISVRISDIGLSKGYAESESVSIVAVYAESTEYSIENTTITQISANTTVSAFIGNIKNVSTYTITYNESELSESDIIKTGCTMTVTYPDKTVTYNLYVLGDINGDGLMTTEDAQIIRDYLLGRTTVMPDLMCADINLDGYVDARDSILIKQQIQ